MKYSANRLVTAKQLLVMAVFALLLPIQHLSAQAKKSGGNKPAVNKPAAKKPAANKPEVKKPEGKSGSVSQRPNVSNSGNKTNNISTGNKVNVDNSKKKCKR